MRFTPRPYQAALAAFALRHPHAAILVDMGLGKTAAMLLVIDYLTRRCYRSKGVLIVAPLRVCTSVWPDEIAKWDNFAGMTWVHISGSAAGVERIKDFDIVRTKPNAKALAALAPGKDIYLVNYENVPSLCAWALSQKVLPFDAVIFDESSKIKASTSARFRGMKSLLPRMGRRVIMTGTPMPRSLEDLFAQSWCVDLGAALGRFVTHYRAQYFDQDPYDKYKRSPKPGAVDAVRAKMAPFTFCLMGKDVISLPPVVSNEVAIVLPPRVREAYKQYERELYTALLSHEITAANRGVMTGRLRQLTGGAVFRPGIMGRRAETFDVFHNEKLDALDSILSEAGDNVLILYQFRHEAARILQRYPGTPVLGSGSTGAEHAIRRWQTGTLPLLIAHPDSMSHGLNLQTGGHTIVWYTLPWGQDAYEQTCKRLHRSGQSHPVMVHRIVAKNSIDSDVWQSICTKEDAQDTFTRGLEQRHGR